MENILVNKGNVDAKTLKYYDYLLYRIKKELDGIPPSEEGDTIDGLISQLTKNLKNNNAWDTYGIMPKKAQRQELLILLKDRLLKRKLRLAQKDQNSNTVIQKYDREDDKIWDQTINLGPKKKLMNILRENYPPYLVDK